MGVGPESVGMDRPLATFFLPASPAVKGTMVLVGVARKGFHHNSVSRSGQ